MPQMTPESAPQTNAPSETPKADASGKAKLRIAQRPKQVLPTDRVRLDKQLQMLRCFAAVSTTDRKPVGLEEVAKLAELHTSTVSMCNAFFVAAGLLTREGKAFIPSQAVLDYTVAANEWHDPNAAHRLAADLGASWFAERIRVELQAKGRVSMSEALQSLGEAAGVTKDHEPQLKTLVEYLDTAGLVQQDGDGLKLRSKAPGGGGQPGKTPPAVTHARRSSAGDGAGSGGGPGSINIMINVSMADLAGWEAEKITAFMFGITELMKLNAASRAPQEDANAG